MLLGMVTFLWQESVVLTHKGKQFRSAFVEPFGMDNFTMNDWTWFNLKSLDEDDYFTLSLLPQTQTVATF